MSKLKLSLFLLALLTSVSLNAQVRTTIYVNGDAFRFHPQLQNVSSKNIPLMNVTPDVRSIDSLIQEDNELDARGVGRPARFGHNIESSISMPQGQWTTTEQYNIWSICISSRDAHSLNFVLSDVKLSQNAKLYLFNTDGYMVSGPITAKNINAEGIHPTTVIAGNSVVIQIIEPISDNKHSTLKISEIIHGYKNTFANNNFLKINYYFCNNLITNLNNNGDRLCYI